MSLSQILPASLRQPVFGRARALAAKEGIDLRNWDTLDRHIDSQMRFQTLLGMVIVAASTAVFAIIAPGKLALDTLLEVSCVVALQVITLALPTRLRRLRLALEGLQIIAFASVILLMAGKLQPDERIFHVFATYLLLGIATPALPYRPAYSALFVAGFIAMLALVLPLRLPNGIPFLSMLLLSVIIGIGSWVLAYRTWQLTIENLLLAESHRRRLDELEQANGRLKILASHDPLTGLANRRHATQMFEDRFVKAADTGVGVFLLDIDHFKAFNDRYGHQAGDDCLRSVAETLGYFARQYHGIAARYGGEEFVLVAKSDGARHAARIAEELRLAIERIEVPVGEAEAAATCSASIGVALHSGAESPTLSHLLSLADEALYEAKNAGRNRVKLAA